MLRPCKECGAEISSQANSCPRCGYPLWRERGLRAIGPIFSILFFVLAGIAFWVGHFVVATEVRGLLRVFGLEVFDFLALLNTVSGLGCVIFGLVMRRRRAGAGRA